MAIGNSVQNISSISQQAYLTLQPTGTDEWIIHNIYSNGMIEIYFYNGSIQILVERVNPGRSITNRRFHCTNSKYYRIKNVEYNNINIGYDGVQTK